MSKGEERFRAAVRTILARGEFPTPKLLTAELDWRQVGSSRAGISISGRYTKVRMEELTAAGYRKDPGTGRWKLVVEHAGGKAVSA